MDLSRTDGHVILVRPQLAYSGGVPCTRSDDQASDEAK